MGRGWDTRKERYKQELGTDQEAQMVAYMGIGNREQEMVPLMFDNHKVRDFLCSLTAFELYYPFLNSPPYTP